ncbi:hypothetical protein VP01_3630g3 [Puccinia sorghi]|uniref:Uncharacterized protein n=1 Tax=Puccinia sorghi TaxID=27349 RepID=A0A0L6UUP5_9BASI|nr:hypothetical protein VP01_3630g3 [Puccinia sorghi]
MAQFFKKNEPTKPQEVPLPPTPQTQARFEAPPQLDSQQHIRFSTSTPFTNLPTGGVPETPYPQTEYHNSSAYSLNSFRVRPGFTPRETPEETPVQSPENTRFEKNREIKLPEEWEFKGFLDTKRANITFDGTDVEVFIKLLERMANIQRCGSIILAQQLPLILSNQKISKAIELIEGHITGDWEMLKKDLTRKWGRATPLRRYKEDGIARLVQKAIDNNGNKNNIEYKRFIGDLEEMLDYFTRMEYTNFHPEDGEPLWKSLSGEIKKEVTKELAHAKKLKKTKDGKNIIPAMEVLKCYTEEALVIVDFDGEEEEPAKKNVKIQDPAKTEDPTETIKKLERALDYQKRAAPPHLGRPSSPGPPEIRRFGSPGPPGMRRFYGPFECYYCKKNHAIQDCEDFSQDYKERKVYRFRGVFYYPDKQPILVEKDLSVKDMVKKYSENCRPTIVREETKEAISSVAKIDKWESWISPQVPMDKEELQTHIGFGLRKSQRLQEKGPSASSKPIPSRVPDSSANTPPPNQGNPVRARKNSLPGGWMEEEESGEEEPIPETNAKRAAPEKKKGTAVRSEELSKHITESLAKKFYKQTYTLTLEEILKIFPQFLQTLQNSIPEVEILESSDGTENPLL